MSKIKATKGSRLTTVIKYKASNDVNGNPRNIFVCYHYGQIIGAYDEGYQGVHAMPKWVRDSYTYQSVNVPVSQYNQFMAMRADLNGS